MSRTRQTAFASPPATVLITGGSRGIGKAIAQAMVAAGHKVYATSRNTFSVPRTDSIQWLELDAASPENLRAFLSAEASLLSEVDILINNAGSGVFGRSEHIGTDIHYRLFQLLVHSPIALTHACLPGMRSRSTGAIVNISSLVARLPMPFSSTYNAAKAALSSYTQTLMLENPTGIPTIIDFQPGDYQTAFNEHLNTALPASASTRAVDQDSDPNLSAAWAVIDRNLQAGPHPEQAARSLLKALQKNRHAVITSGSFFQSRLACLAARLLPSDIMRRLIQQHYQIRKR